MKEGEQKTIKEVVGEAIGIRGFSVERLSSLTDVPERYLKAIFNEEPEQLPALPYVRGYLIKIAEVLNLDGDELWQVYKKNLNLKTSGEADKLPQNRFALKRFKKRNLIFAILGIFVIIFLFFKAGQFLGAPSLEINNPSADNFITDISFIELRGLVDPQDKLMVNNEEIPTDKNGYFQKEFTLEPGINSIEFKVKRLLGKEVIITRKVIYQQQ